MGRLRLTTLLVAANVGLLLLAVGGVALVAVRLLSTLADQQALARVEQAGLIAQREIDAAAEATRTSAQLLAERPTLRRLLTEGDRPALDAFLAQFQGTSGLDSAAVLREGELVGRSGTAAYGDEGMAGGTPGAFIAVDADGATLFVGARAAVTAIPNTSVLVGSLLDTEFEQRASASIGLPVAVHTVGEDDPTAELPAALRADVLARRALSSARFDALGSYVAAAPLIDSTGNVVGFVETRLPTSDAAQSLRRLASTMVLLALTVGTLAGLFSFALGRRLGHPLRTLAIAAARIGRGDLETPVPIPSGAETGTLATTLDDMRHRLLRMTDDLRGKQAEAEAIITGIVEGVFSVDRERRIRFLNHQAAAMLDTTPEAALGRFCGDVLYPAGMKATRPCEEHCPIVHARFRGSARATEHLLLANGRRRTVVITSAPAVDGMQVQVLRDETEIEATRRLRDSILANISHEFKTPLSAQLASIDLLLDQLPDLSIEQVRQLVLAQQRGTLRLTQLIDNLLESARIEAGQDTIRKHPVALDGVVEEALELTRPLLEQRRQRVEVDLPYPLPSIVGDTRRLTQVFVNLLGNANKFAPNGSHIRVAGRVDSAVVALWVEDQGPGLATVDSTVLFDRWVRSTRDEPAQSGVGLGLWLVKSIVERHGGRIEARSGEHGTRMTVVLPREQANENPDRG